MSRETGQNPDAGAEERAGPSAPGPPGQGPSTETPSTGNGGGLPVSDPSLWLGVFGAAGAWTAHLLFGVAFGSAACAMTGGDVARHGLSWWILATATAGFLGIALASILLSIRNLHRLGVRVGGTDDVSGEPRARAIFLAFAGVLLGGVFLVALGFSAVAALSVPLCR